MRVQWAALRPDRVGRPALAGGSASLAVGVLLYTRYSIDSALNRDEGIYVYGGQHMLRGVAPYASIFDPKTPLATMLCALGAALAKLFGVNDVHMIRVVFLACSVLTVLAIYLLVVQLWQSVVAGLVAAVVFASFQAFAEDALGGPDAKTPGVLFAVLTMWLVARRQWFWAGFAGGLAFLVWQPFLFLPLMAVVTAVALSPGARWRASAVSAGGVAAPIAATVVYFVSVGQFGKFWESALQFPLEGVQRSKQTLPQRLRHIVSVIDSCFHFSAVLFWIGMALLAGVAVATVVRARRGWRTTLIDPFILVVVLTLVGEAAYAATDFQWYPDVFPLLPYPAIGFGAATALALRRLRRPEALRAAATVALAASTVLAALSAVLFTRDRLNDHELVVERAQACAVDRLLVPGMPLYSLGDPVPLVLTHRRNPDRFIYLFSGVAAWKSEHTRGGFAGWMAQIRAAHPSVVVVHAWAGRWERRAVRWLRTAGFRSGYVGDWRVFLSPEARAQAPNAGIEVTRRPTERAQAGGRAEFTEQDCGGS